jgi:hypothetical protein
MIGSNAMVVSYGILIVSAVFAYDAWNRASESRLKLLQVISLDLLYQTRLLFTTKITT